MASNQKGWGVIDTVVVILVISVFIVIFIPKYQRTAREAQETAMMAELNNIRMSLDLYKMHNSKYPSDLRELITKEYLQPGREDTIFKKAYLEAHALDEEGYPVDPFNNRFKYNQETGKVSSQTSGYEKW